MTKKSQKMFRCLNEFSTFTKIDCTNVSVQLSLDKQSSALTASNTTFCLYSPNGPIVTLALLTIPLRGMHEPEGIESHQDNISVHCPIRTTHNNRPRISLKRFSPFSAVAYQTKWFWSAHMFVLHICIESYSFHWKFRAYDSIQRGIIARQHNFCSWLYLIYLCFTFHFSQRIRWFFTFCQLVHPARI